MHPCFLPYQKTGLADPIYPNADGSEMNLRVGSDRECLCGRERVQTDGQIRVSIRWDLAAYALLANNVGSPQ